MVVTSRVEVESGRVPENFEIPEEIVFPEKPGYLFSNYSTMLYSSLQNCKYTVQFLLV